MIVVPLLKVVRGDQHPLAPNNFAVTAHSSPHPIRTTRLVISGKPCGAGYRACAWQSHAQARQPAPHAILGRRTAAVSALLYPLVSFRDGQPLISKRSHFFPARAICQLLDTYAPGLAMR